MLFHNTNKVELIYTISCVSAFALLFYANAEAQEAPDGHVVQLGIGKSFYFPCAVALISSFYLHKVKDELDRNLNLILFFTIVSSLIHPPMIGNVLTSQLTRFIFAILCFRDLRNVNPLLVAKCVAYISPIIVFPHYLLSNPFSYGAYRYAGFYGDANFLALALNLVIALCYITIMKTDVKIVKIACIASIVGSVPLIFLGMSRGGILGLVIIGFFILRSLSQYSKKWFILVLCLTCFSVVSFTARNADLFQSIESRFLNDNDSDEASTMNRVESMESVYNVLTNCPYLIPFGIGMGNTVRTIPEYRIHGFFVKSNIHNTFFSLLYEAGIIVLLLYCSLFWITAKRLFQQKNNLLLSVLLTSMLSLFTLPGVSFMPAWIMLFLLSNKNVNGLSIT